MQDPVAVRAEGDALLLGLADRGGDVAVLDGKIVDRLLVLANDMVEVDHRGVRKATMGAGLVRSVGLPAFLLFSLAPRDGGDGLGFVGEIPAPRVFPLPFASDLIVLERHLELLFPVQGSRERVGDGWRVELEATRDEVIGAWFVIRGV